jgi:3-methyl-2-oxobutanoate hydroxymethyltransferase
MVYLKQQRPEKVTVPAVRASKERGERLVCLTAYDYPTARIVDEAGTDIVLVGDSLGNVVLGYDSTVPVTLEEMLHHTRAVRRGVERALLVADMPYGSYHTGPDDAVRAALRLIKDGGAEAVKLEGGRNRIEVIRRLVAEEIPVMGHIGLTPQSLNKLGSYRLQAKTADAARRLVEDALLLEEAGVFAVVLEVVPREVAREVTRALHVPTIGIGAGADCDAQILVTHDLLGLSFSRSSPRFVRQYADVRETMADAINRYAEDVRSGAFPSDAESYPLPADAAATLGFADKKDSLESEV